MTNEKLLLLALLLVAFALRLIALDHIPAGLSHDEANNGLAALQILAGDRPIFLEINKGIEPLIIYLEALSFYAYGVGVWQMRWVNVLAGMLTVALIYPLTRRLLNRRVAMLALAGIAVSFWAIFVSRLTLRAVMLPPLLTLMLYLLWRGLTNPRPNRKFWLDYGVSGLVMGLTMYSYLSARFIPLLNIWLFAMYQMLGGQRQSWRRHGLAFLGHGLIGLLIFMPLGQYYVNHRDSFSHRANQVSTLPYLLNGDVTPLLKNTIYTLGMFTFAGDETDRYNLDGRPIFDGLNGLIFYLGIVLVLRTVYLRCLNRSTMAYKPLSALFLFSWYFIMLLPGFITDDSPHFLRTIGVLPITYIFWAIGLDWTGKRLALLNPHPQPLSQGERGDKNNPLSQGERGDKNNPLSQGERGDKNNSLSHRERVGVRVHFLFAITLWTLLTLHTTYDYFQRWANAAGARQIYGADIAEIANYVQNNYNEEVTAISAAYYRDEEPFRYTLHWHGQPPFTLWFDGQQSIAFPPAESHLSIRYLFADSAPPNALWLEFLQPVPAESGRAYQLYRLPDTFRIAKVKELQPLAYVINNDVNLNGYRVLGQVVSGGKFQLLLAWQALRALPPATDYTWLARLWDEQGHEWAQADGLGYAPSDWQPGVQGLQLLTFRLPADLPPGQYSLTIELVNRQTGQPLPAVNGATRLDLVTLMGKAKVP